MKTSKQKVFSVIESILFASPDPTPISTFLQVFEEEFSQQEMLRFLEEFKESLKQEERGLTLEKINKGYQLRTKTENKNYLLKMFKKRPFRLSGPSLEVLSIVAYKQPCPKQEIDQIRGVDSSHLLRTLMEKEVVVFAGKSDLPGKPSLYKTSERFLEVFGFNSLKDLPSEEEIAELLPQIEESVEEKEELHQITDTLSEENLAIPYEQDEQENQKLKDTLKSIPTTVDFLKEEKKNLKEEPSS